MKIFLFNAFENPQFFFTIVLSVVFSICLHEYCHARMALFFGDSTAADAGHLTLNPMKQMGLTSLFMFLILGFAWGAVPVDPAVLRARNRHASALVSLAGPAANFGLFAISFFVFGFLGSRISLLIPDENVGIGIMMFFLVMGSYNAFLFLFNLLPIPGLDGWNILTEYIPRLKYLSSEAAKGVTIFLIFALLFCTDYLFSLSRQIMILSVELLSA